jgi:divalent metal cation (Fe/Co/Zn/Cd) transporter
VSEHCEHHSPGQLVKPKPKDKLAAPIKAKLGWEPPARDVGLAHTPMVRSDLRRAFRLEYATIAWNAAEAAIALTFGILAGSLALTAFGIDSVIEVFAAVVVLFELRGHTGRGEEHDPARLFLGLIGGSFFLLATYIVIEALWDVLTRARPHESIPGIVLTSLSLATMWFLARAKHRVGHEINCRPLIADSQETRLCALLSAVTLAGLALNAAFSWWWADPVAALGIAVLAGVEGYEAIQGQHPEHH